MEITEALKEFNIVDILSIDTTQLKREYRRRMKEYHPDSNISLKSVDDGRQANAEDAAARLNQAYVAIMRILKREEARRKIEQAHKKVYFITFDELKNVYECQDVRVWATDSSEQDGQRCQEVDSVVLNRYNIYKHRVYILADIQIDYKEADSEEVKSVIDSYMTSVDMQSGIPVHSVECDIPVESMGRVDVRIKAGGKEATYSMDYSGIKVPFVFDNGLKLIVGVNKKLE